MKTDFTFKSHKKEGSKTPLNLKGAVLKCVAALFLILSSVETASSQVASYVGNGTTTNATTDYPAPYGNDYWFSRHQLFFTPAELTAAGVMPGSTISSFAFNVLTKNTQTLLYQWSVAIYTTTSNDPLATAMVTTGQVASGGPPVATYNATLGWNTHTVTPFMWNGTDGVIVETCHAHISAWTTNASTYWTTNLSGPTTKSRWWNADNVTACQNSGNGPYTSTTTRPNIRFDWYGSPCNQTPATNTTLPLSFTTCPGLQNPTLTLANTYTNAGITFQWFSSTVSPVGLFTAVNGATLSSAPVPTLGVTTWFQAVVSCTNPGGGTTSVTASQMFVAGSTSSTVPCYEDFEGIMMANRLPNCSWYAPNIGTSVNTYMAPTTNNRVPRSGTKFGSFGLPSSNNMVYTNGIAMSPGITYSASVWYATEYLGASNWTNLSILVGPNQSTTGLVQVASISPAISGAYKQLSGVFTVPSSGNYYVALKATAANGTALYLSWDDLSVTIPCQGAGAVNSPTVVVAVASPTICTGQSINLSANGADSYVWNTGATTAGITETPLVAGPTSYTVTGMNALTGCMHTVIQPIMVEQSPVVLVSAYPATVCVGQPVTISAIGSASSYLWSNGLNTGVITVTTSAPASYTVVATGLNGCTSEATQAVGTYSLPLVTATSDAAEPCIGDKIVLTAAGGSTYNWVSNTSPNILQGTSVNVFLSSQTIFTITGTSLNGCSAKTTLSQNVNECVGVNEFTSLKGLMVYPNPASDAFTVELNSASLKTIEVMDLSGRIIIASSSSDEKINVNVQGIANGVYYVKIKTTDGVEVIKIVKQ